MLSFLHFISIVLSFLHFISIVLSFLHLISIVLSFLQRPVLKFGKDRLGAHSIVLHPCFNSFFCLFIYLFFVIEIRGMIRLCIIVNYVSISNCVQYV